MMSETPSSYPFKRALSEFSEYDGDFFLPRAVGHVLKHLEAVHNRHDDIQKHDQDSIMVRFQQFQRLTAVFSLKDFV